MTTRRSAFSACILMTALLAGCGGGGGGGNPVPTPVNTGGHGQSASVKITLGIPAAQSSSAKAPRSRNYVSPSTNGIGISVVAHGGTFPAMVTPSDAYDVSAGSSYCVAGGGGSRTCTFYVPAPAGADDFQVSGWDAAPVNGSFVGAHLLSQSVESNQTISGTATNVLNFSMSGTVHSIFLRLSSATMVAGQQNNTYTLNVEALDADGNIISGSDPFVDANGNALSIAINVSPAGGPGTITLAPNAPVTNPSNSTFTLNYNGALLSSALFTAVPSRAIAGTNTSATLKFTISNGALNFPGTPVVTTYGVASGSNPMGIVANGVDGNLWFAENGATLIGRSTTAGSLSTFGSGHITSAPTAVAYGLDGDTYFAEAAGGFGRIDPYTETVQELLGPTIAGALTQGPQADNDIWFTDPANNDVGCVGFGSYANAGSACNLVEYGTSSTPDAIVIGPDGNVWFTFSNASTVGTMTTAGAGLTTYPLSGPGNGIAVGGDGNLWITENGKIARVTTGGTVTEFGSLSSAATQIVSAMDGNLWFIEPGSGTIGRVTTAGVVSEFPTGLGASGNLSGLAAGPDGNLWFTAPGANEIGKVQP